MWTILNCDDCYRSHAFRTFEMDNTRERTSSSQQGHQLMVQAETCLAHGDIGQASRLFLEAADLFDQLANSSKNMSTSRGLRTLAWSCRQKAGRFPIPGQIPGTESSLTRPTDQSLISLSIQLRQRPNESDQDAQIHKYSRAQIHLFLRVRFGILDFGVVENQITDGTGDGGLDAYHIDEDKKTIYLIQSKYKTTPEGYLNNAVDWREFFKMELDRIVRGEAGSISGNEYNGKVKIFQQKVTNISDIGRWKYALVYLGNVPSAITKENLLGISGGVCRDAEVLHGNDFYNQVLIPYLKRDFYNKEDFSFEIYMHVT